MVVKYFCRGDFVFVFFESTNLHEAAGASEAVICVHHGDSERWGPRCARLEVDTPLFVLS